MARDLVRPGRNGFHGVEKRGKSIVALCVAVIGSKGTWDSFRLADLQQFAVCDPSGRSAIDYLRPSMKGK
jgi:hypothetical protein